MNLVGRAQRCHDYIRALEEERRKIEAFQRELPLCLELVTLAIDSVRRKMDDEEIRLAQNSEKSKLLALPATLEDRSEANESAETVRAAVSSPATKTDWLSSGEQDSDAALKMSYVQEVPVKPLAVRKIGGAFRPFEKEKQVKPPTVPASSTTSGGGEEGNGSMPDKEDREGCVSQPRRKTRRCWSAELHHRFLNALQQLGGAHVATPKQIREAMMVDGLTSDEIKSHLQKYRLHARRPSPARSCSSISPAAAQFVLVSGMLAPPPENYTAETQNGASAAPRRIYAPVATLLPHLRLHPPPPKKRQVDHERSTTKPSDTGRTSLPSEATPTNSTAFTGTQSLTLHLPRPRRRPLHFNPRRVN